MASVSNLRNNANYMYENGLIELLKMFVINGVGNEKKWNNGVGRIITKKMVKRSSRINDLSNNFKVSFSVDSSISWYNIIATEYCYTI